MRGTFSNEQVTRALSPASDRDLGLLGASIFGAILVALGAVALGLSGADWAASAGASLVVFVQGVSGGLVTMLIVRRQLTVLEFVGGGLAVGSACAVVLMILGSPFGPQARAWGWLVLPGATLATFLVGRGRKWLPGSIGLRWDRPSALVAAVGGAAVGLAALAVNLGRYPLSGPWERFHPDMPFFEALGTSTVKFGPGVDVFMAGDEIRYHWLAYAWPGQLTVALDLAPFLALTRLVPALVVVGLAALTAGVVGRLGRRWWGPVLAVALVVSGGFAGAAYGVVPNVDSPSTALTALWLLCFVVLASNSRLDPRVGFVVALMVGFLLSGAKVSAIAVLGMAWIVIVFLGVAWRAAWMRSALIQLFGLLVGATVSFLAFVVGSASSGDLRLLTWDFRASSVQGLDFGSGWWGVAVGTLLLSIAVVPRAAGIFGLRPRSHEVALAVGLVAASVVPLWLLSQGVNELWFAVAAAAPLAVLSALGLEGLWDRVDASDGARRWSVAAVLAGLVSAGAIAVLWPFGASDVISVRSVGPLLPWIVGAVLAAAAWLRSGRSIGVAVLATTLVVTASLGRGITAFGDVGLESSTGRNLPARSESVASNTVPKETPASEQRTPNGAQLPPTPVMVESVEWSHLRNEAALWLRDRAASGDILANDQTESAMIPAVTAMKTYLSAYPYQLMYGTRGQAALVGERQVYSQGLSNGLRAESREAFCAAGVDWLWIENRLKDVDLPLAFMNEEVTIYALEETSCAD